MTSARGKRVLAVIASTRGNSASAKNRLIPTSRITPRTRQTRYNPIAQAAKINTARTIPASDGVASRTKRASSPAGPAIAGMRRATLGGGSATGCAGAVALGGSELLVGAPVTASHRPR